MRLSTIFLFALPLVAGISLEKSPEGKGVWDRAEDTREKSFHGYEAKSPSRKFGVKAHRQLEGHDLVFTYIGVETNKLYAYNIQGAVPAVAPKRDFLEGCTDLCDENKQCAGFVDVHEHSKENPVRYCNFKTKVNTVQVKKARKRDIFIKRKFHSNAGHTMKYATQNQ